MFRILALAAGLALSSSAVCAQAGFATADTTATTAATQAGPADASSQLEARNSRQSTTGDPDRKVCRSEAQLGSRLGGKKICKSARDWELQRQESKAQIDRMQTQRGMVGN